MRKLAAIVLVVLLVGCAPPPGNETTGGEGAGRWSYAKGPHGENCIFYQEGVLQSRVLAMSCDKVVPE